MSIIDGEVEGGPRVYQLTTAPPQPESGSPEAVEPDIDDTYACACHCTCCAPVEAEGERCPMCSEACGPEAVEQAPRALEDFCWPADASPEQVTGGVMTSRQCEKLVQEAFPVAQAAETIRTQALAIRSQESLDSATRVMEWYLKSAQVELADALEEWHRPWEAIEKLEGGDGRLYAGYYARDDGGVPTLVYVTVGEWEKVLRTREALRKAGR